MQNIYGLFPPWIQWTSSLTGYFSAMDNKQLLRGDDFFALWTCLITFVCVYVCQGHLCSRIFFSLYKSETEIPPPCVCCRVGCQSSSKNHPKNVFFIAAGRSRVRAAHSHTFTHLGAVRYHQCHCVLLTDHLHQSLRSVCLRGLCLSEMRKEKIGPVQAGRDKAQQLLTHTHTQSVSGLTPPRRPTLPSLSCAPAPFLPLQQ